MKLIISVIFFSIIAVALVAYFMFYKKTKAKTVEKLLDDDMDITSITFSRGGATVEFEKTRDNWQIVRPNAWEANQEKMRRFISKLVILNIEEYFPNLNPDDPAYGIGKNGSITIEGGSSKISITLGGTYKKNEEFIYMRKTDEKGLSIISSSILSVLPVSSDSFNNMTLFDGFASQIESVEASSAAHDVYLLVRTANGWIMKGRNLFDEKVKPFLEQITTLEAEGFLEEDLKLAPKADAYITLKIGKKTIARNFFSYNESYYVIPIGAKLMKIKKESLDFIFNFK